MSDQSAAPAPPQPRRIVEPLPGCDPVIGRWLWALENARRRTLATLDDMLPEALDAAPPVGRNTIGGLLYHIAGAEATWLYKNLLQVEFPREIAALFPDEIWGEEGLPVFAGQPLSTYLDRLQIVRDQFLAVYKGMTLDEFREVGQRHYWNGDPYETTAETIINHLMQHEAEHRGHIHVIKDWVAQNR
jgi:uncharacterized damage-inducible protein DinB